jgi:UPF0755 protein
MKSAKAILLACLGLCMIGGVFFFISFANVAWFSKEEAGAPITIEVTNQMTASEVRALLAEHGLVSSFLYRLYATADDGANKPKAGSYTFRKGASYQQIAQTLFRGPIRTERTVRLVEGKTIDENGQALQGSGFDPIPYWKLTGRSKNLEPFDSSLVAEYSFLVDIPKNQSLEGYLFPDTYSLYEDQIPAGLVRLQLDTFERKVVKPLADAQKASGMTWHEVITLASIVESEVRKPEDRKIVADIFLRRLKNHMRLQSDATLNYVMDHRNDRPTSEDLSINSLYNSYDHDGLPPGPISNPSFSAIDAVLHPTETDEYYFLTDPQGKVYYAKTYDEHLANKRKVYGN